MANIREDPGVAAAIAQERELRQEAWLGAEEDIVGIPVAPLTPRKVFMLGLAGNYYLADSKTEVGIYDQGLFLWVVSQRFQPGAIRARDRFFKCLKKKDVVQTHREIHAYLERSFFDAPTDSGSSGAAPMADWIALIIHEMAHAYGWSIDTALDTPFRQLLQLRRCIQLTTDPEARARLGNRLSDHAKAEFYDRLNTPAPPIPNS